MLISVSRAEKATAASAVPSHHASARQPDKERQEKEQEDAKEEGKGKGGPGTIP